MKFLVILAVGLTAAFHMACSKNSIPGSPFSSSTAMHLNRGVVTTFAGSGTAAEVDGTGTAASFNLPESVAVDSSGNVYVADYTGNTIRKITPGGVVSTFAGSGTAAETNGTGTGASFNSPEGMAFDGSGNLYVADYSGNTIRQITPGGVVSTFAGSGASGHNNATGTAATFYEPTDVTVDSSGNVYVTDGGNSLIRKITPGGVVTTLAGTGSLGHVDGTGTAASFYGPYGLAVDGSGNIFVADCYNYTIRKVTPGGVVTTFAGTAGVPGHVDGTGAAASFWYPTNLSFDSLDNLYVTDYNNSDIRKITPGAVVTTFAGTTTLGRADGTGTAASFDYPWGIAVNQSNNIIYVGDYGNNLIREIQ